MAQWLSGQVIPGEQPTVVLVPNGTAWSAYPNRRLHLGMDQIAPTSSAGSVRVAIHNGTSWRSIQSVELAAARGTVDVPLTSGDVKISLQTTTSGITYAVETW
ncbi:hypothetical protein [Streptomyces blastmyceticus]|uniref:Uncharacterized protein n=1 Tax=Streptomyces blastmyceticus TaxID=68180 RepID=A0ABN0XI67_9ACTN